MVFSMAVVALWRCVGAINSRATLDQIRLREAQSRAGICDRDHPDAACSDGADGGPHH